MELQPRTARSPRFRVARRPQQTRNRDGSANPPDQNHDRSQEKTPEQITTRSYIGRVDEERIVGDCVHTYSTRKRTTVAQLLERRCPRLFD